jgi:hypothetical protein
VGGLAAVSSSAVSGEPAKALKPLDEFTGRNGLGVVAGFGSGLGVSYRRYVTDTFALRGAGYVLYIKDAVSLYNVGVLAQYDLHRDEKYMLYLVGGVTYGHSSIHLGSLPVDPGVFPNAGVGVELGKHDHPGLTYQIELALTAMLGGEKFRLLPLPQLGIHYIF